MTVAFWALRWGPPVRFFARPSASTEADCGAGLEWTGTGGAEGGAGVGVKAEFKLEDAWEAGPATLPLLGLKLTPDVAAFGPAGGVILLLPRLELTPNVGTADPADGTTLLSLEMELAPAVATTGPAGGFQLGSSQGASAALASRRIVTSSPGCGGRR